MLIWQLLRWLLLAAEIGIALPLIYLDVISFSALLAIRRRKRAAEDGYTHALAGAQSHFAICIPAHDEEVLIATVLESLSQLDYPKDLYTTYVVADNCSDTTAEIARRVDGIQVFERFDETRRGKGYALNWILQQLEERQLRYDAYIVLDADSVVVPTFLQLMDKELRRGAEAIQGCNTVLNVTQSPSTVLRWIALTLMNHVRPLGRNGIGGSSTLTGNGMCLSYSLLQRHPWRAFTIVEDYQYYLNLVLHGEKVHYVPEAVVRTPMPTTFEQMRTQDVRWEASEQQQPHWQIAGQLLRGAFSSRGWVRIDAVAELLTPPLSSLVALCLLALAASVLFWSLPVLLLGIALCVGLFCYIATAFYLLRPPRAVYKALLHAPTFMLWKLWVYFVLSRTKKHTSQWVRTSRTAS